MALDMNTLNRWQRAAQRALAADLTGDLVQRGSSVLVASQTTAGKRYAVRLVGNRAGQCNCEAGLLNKPCAHRAAVALRIYERQYGVKVTAIKPAAVVGMERYLRAN